MVRDSEDPKPTGPPLQEEVKQDNKGNEGKTNLIINYLPQCHTDKEFCNIFPPIGSIEASKIAHHKATGQSYGFGFIDYRDAGDAARALDSLNGLQVLNKTAQVSHARPGGETVYRAMLYVRGIPKDYAHERAEEVFANVGKILQFRVIKEKSSAGTEVAFVLYDFRQNAEAAMAKLAGTTLPDATEALVIQYAQPKTPRKESGVRGVPRQVASAHNDAMGGGSGRRSYGWNERKPRKGYHHYRAGMTQKEVASRGKTLFIYDIGAEWDQSSLRRFPSNYGNVLNVNDVRYTANSLSGGYGLVGAATTRYGMAAVEALNGSR
ncbi:ELAV-like protein 1 [Haemaphysalis longicornis]